MTNVEIKRYQKCELCHNTLEIKDELKTVKLPCSLNGSVHIETLSICYACTEKLHEVLREKITIEEIEYAGVICKWLI